jgi:ABC-type lipoprotein export system ATPase subunit
MSALLEARGIAKSYRVGESHVPVLRDVSIEITGGSFVALSGPSGSGKTTLMNILGLLDVPDSGELLLEGRPVHEMSSDARATLRNDCLGFVFQNFQLLPKLPAWANVRLPLLYGERRPSRREARERASALLRRVGLGDRLNHEPSQLSGGQQQRVAIARALVRQPRILLADEPTGNLDSRSSEEVLTLLEQIRKEDDLAVLLVTHDNEVLEHAEHIVEMRDGRIRPSSESQLIHMRRVEAQS